MESEQFVILVADRDATVGVVSTKILASAFSTESNAVNAVVRVLIESQSISKIDYLELPEVVREIEEVALIATPAEIEATKLIVSFSGVNGLKLGEIRERGITAPAVNLCQFVDILEGFACNSLNFRLSVQEVIVNVALQFGFSGGSSICSICEAQEREKIHYWVSIADTCSRFAQTVQQLRSSDRN